MIDIIDWNDSEKISKKWIFCITQTFVLLFIPIRNRKILLLIAWCTKVWLCWWTIWSNLKLTCVPESRISLNSLQAQQLITEPSFVRCFHSMWLSMACTAYVRIWPVVQVQEGKRGDGGEGTSGNYICRI